MNLFRFLRRKILVLTMLFGLFLTQSVKAQTLSTSKIVFLTDTGVTLDGLLNRFKGKIVYVDIWATWCVPCRQELQMKKEVQGFQEFASKNDVILLYICCDKNSNSWKQYISANNLAGYHMLVNKQINKAFHTTFSMVQSRHRPTKQRFYIPRHLIIDQNGIIADSAAARQGSASVYQKIHNLLGK